MGYSASNNHILKAAQPQLQLHFWLRLALTPISPANHQSVANIFFGTEYEYEYIWNVLFNTNTNMNIFGIDFLEVFSLNPTGLQGIDPSGLEHFLVGD